MIWAASVHSVKTLDGIAGREGMVPLGFYIHRALGDRAAVVAVSPVSGSIGRPGRPPKNLDPAPAGSIEVGGPRYLDHDELEALGKVPARVLGADHHTVRWSDLLDGILVIPEERPI